MHVTPVAGATPCTKQALCTCQKSKHAAVTECTFAVDEASTADTEEQIQVRADCDYGCADAQSCGSVGAAMRSRSVRKHVKWRPGVGLQVLGRQIDSACCIIADVHVGRCSLVVAACARLPSLTALAKLHHEQHCIGC